MPRLLLLLIVSAAAPLAAQTRATAGFPSPAGLLGFGSTIALSGDELFVGRTGSPLAFPMPPSETGAVHRFVRGPADGAWTEAQAVAAGDLTPGDGFGSAIAARGSRLAVGAPQHGGSGRVYLFERRDGGWVAAGVLQAPDPAPGDEFGRALAFGGEGLLLVGAPGRDSARGAAFAFPAPGGPGGPGAPGVRVGGGTETGERFGSAIALDGATALIGAPGEIPLGGFGGAPAKLKRGTAVVFQRDGAGWVETARLVPEGADTLGAFGFAVGLEGSEALISAPMAGQGGGVYGYRRDAAGTWTLTQRVRSAAPSPLFGYTVQASGTTLLVGAPAANQGAGQVHAFARVEGAWVEQQQLRVTGAGLGLLFGAAIGLEGDHAVIGGPLADFFEGVAYAFDRDPASGRWRDRGTVTEARAGFAEVRGGEVQCDQGRARAFPCDRVDLLGFLPVSALGARRGIMLNDLWGWTDPETNREYALVGRMDATVFVDVTDPSNPVLLGELPLHAGARPNLWRDIKVYRDHAFIVADNAGPHGVQVFDLTQLRRTAGTSVTFAETAHYDKIASAHNIVINEATGFAYTVGNSGGGETCGGALHMIDIRDPLHPTFAGCFSDPSTGNARTGYTHDAQCVRYHGPDARYQGREVCFNASETAVGIADVTDKTAPKPIAVAAYPNVGYTHQGWLSEDHRYFFLDDELDELQGAVNRTRTLVWDVSDLEEPVLAREFLGTTGASDHNLYVRGTYLYQSDYVAGLRVLDISDPRNPREVGYFDTVPGGENVPGFAGSWSNYPFFKSGTIAVTSMREGLFLLRYRPARLIP